MYIIKLEGNTPVHIIIALLHTSASSICLLAVAFFLIRRLVREHFLRYTGAKREKRVIGRKS